MATKTRPKKAKKKGERLFQDLEDLQENHVALFYGKSGRGKTEVASTFPSPILFIDINNEKGLKTLRGKRGIKVAKANTWEKFQDLFWALREGDGGFKTIVLDQISGLQDMALTEIRRKRKKKSGELFTRKNWGELSGELKEWLQNFRSLSDEYNVVFIAHERAFGGEGEDEEDEIDPNVGARVMPSVGDYVAGACDIIGQCFIRSTKERNEQGKIERSVQYCMRVGPHPVYLTKIRRPAADGPLPEIIINPSYQKLVAIENGEKVSTPKTLKKRRAVNGKKQ